MAPPAEDIRAQALLRCLDADGGPRYDLPARHVGIHEGYEIFWRPAPAPVIHHLKGATLYLGESEFVLVARAYRHCLSVTPDEHGKPRSIYANINLLAVEDAGGWSWRDLELDVKFRLDVEDRWRAILLDVEEFDAATLNTEQRGLTKLEIARVVDRAEAELFPFSRNLPPWLGLDPARFGMQR